MTVELELSVDSQTVQGALATRGRRKCMMCSTVFWVFKSQATCIFFYINLMFDHGGFSQLLLELTVLEETFSYRNPCSFLFPLANQLYFDLK